jgi:hypothetical protein
MGFTSLIAHTSSFTNLSTTRAKNLTPKVLEAQIEHDPVSHFTTESDHHMPLPLSS